MRTEILVVHHPDDTPYVDEVTEGLLEHELRLRRLPALPREEVDRRGGPKPRFEPHQAPLLYVLSSRFPQTSWFEFLDRARPGRADPVQVSLLFEDCSIPSLLQDKACIDFREREHRRQSLRLLVDLVRTVPPPFLGDPVGAETVEVPDAEAKAQVPMFYVRPERWFCIFCGWECKDEANSYHCGGCGKIRPFAGGSATMIQCNGCHRFSLGVAAFCEWCGEAL